MEWNCYRSASLMNTSKADTKKRTGQTPYGGLVRVRPVLARTIWTNVRKCPRPSAPSPVVAGKKIARAGMIIAGSGSARNLNERHHNERQT